MTDYCQLGIMLTLALCCLQVALATNCNEPCPACPAVEQCAPGVNLIKDECGCCKTCSRQLHESCDAVHPCDKQKNLYCAFGDTSEKTGICVAKPGRSCFLDGKVYLSGESFTRGCRFVCTCVDSDISCLPQCPQKQPIPRGCLHPRLVRKPGQCCSEWICASSKPQEPRQNYSPSNLLKRLSAASQRTLFQVSDAQRKSDETLHLRAENQCDLQSTQWSPCSKTCGWGVSDRVTNANKACKLEKQVRLCQIRPCGQNFTPETKGKKCARTPKATKPVRYSFSGCTSKVYFPKYCGQCNDGRICMPERTKTVSVTFRCDDGFSFKKRMMEVKSCSCRGQSSSNDVFPGTKE